MRLADLLGDHAHEAPAASLEQLVDAETDLLVALVTRLDGLASAPRGLQACRRLVEDAAQLTPRLGALGRREQELVLGHVVDQLLTFGPLLAPMVAGDVTEITVNAPDTVWVERAGKKREHHPVFVDEDHLRQTVDRLLLLNPGKRLDEATAQRDRLVTEAHDAWGMRFFVLTGGEPLSYRSEGLGVLDLAERHPDGHHPLGSVLAEGGDWPSAVAEAADGGDPLAREALQLWLGAYGAVTGDLALTTLCQGGIWLAGGTAGKQLEGLRSPAFLDAFLAKGRLRPVLEPIPIQAITDPAVGVFSAACRARMLAGGGMGH